MERVRLLKTEGGEMKRSFVKAVIGTGTLLSFVFAALYLSPLWLEITRIELFLLHLALGLMLLYLLYEANKKRPDISEEVMREIERIKRELVEER